MWREISKVAFNAYRTANEGLVATARGVMRGGGMYAEYGYPNLSLLRTEHKRGGIRCYVFASTPE